MQEKIEPQSVYLVDQYERYCPENNNGYNIVAAFSTLKKAEDFIDKYDPIGKKNKRESSNGLQIIELLLDIDPFKYREEKETAKDRKINQQAFEKILTEIKKNLPRID